MNPQAITRRFAKIRIPPFGMARFISKNSAAARETPATRFEGDRHLPNFRHLGDGEYAFPGRAWIR
jgi:hypothetical protein